MTAPVEISPPPNVRGFRLDGSGTYVITPEENAALCRSVGAEPASDGTAHPIYYFIATQLGTGPTVDEFLGACDFDVADGPMVLGTAVSFNQPLKVATPYSVKGEFISLTRKQSRRIGVMDLLDYRLLLHDGDDVVLEVTNTLALPRKEFS